MWTWFGTGVSTIAKEASREVAKEATLTVVREVAKNSTQDILKTIIKAS
jgi:hypothetical protein